MAGRGRELLLALLMCVVATIRAMSPTGNPTSTFMAGRVNLPGKMYNKGYYVVGSFQVRPRDTRVPRYAPLSCVASFFARG